MRKGRGVELVLTVCVVVVVVDARLNKETARKLQAVNPSGAAAAPRA